MGLVRVEGPRRKPLSCDDAVAQLRLDDAEAASSEALLSALIDAACDYCETVTRKRFITQTWQLTLDGFPAGCIELPNPPVQEVTAITYLDGSGASQTLSTALYRVDTTGERGRIVPAYNTVWPITYRVPAAVTIEFMCGFGDAAADVPASIRHAMKMLIATWYAQRESVVIGQIPATVPHAVDALLWSQRSLEVG